MGRYFKEPQVLDGDGANLCNRGELEGVGGDIFSYCMDQQPQNRSGHRANSGDRPMSGINLVVGGIGAAIALQLAALAVLPDVKPIVVHSLNYSDGIVHQDRSITAEGGTFPAEWRASIIDTVTQKPVPECSGSGFWPYKTGRQTAPIPLHEWVGSDACTPEYLRGLGGEYYPVASWHWGNEFITKSGPVFRP